MSEQGMKQAKPSEEQFGAVVDFMNGLESIFECCVHPETEEDMGGPGCELRICEWLDNAWDKVSPVWQRVLWAGKCAIDNACDPDADTLEWNSKIKAALEHVASCEEKP